MVPAILWGRHHLSPSPNPRATFNVTVADSLTSKSKWIYYRGGYLISQTGEGSVGLFLWPPGPSHETHPLHVEISKRSRTDPSPGKQNLFFSKGVEIIYYFPGLKKFFFKPRRQRGLPSEMYIITMVVNTHLSPCVLILAF